MDLIGHPTANWLAAASLAAWLSCGSAGAVQERAADPARTSGPAGVTDHHKAVDARSYPWSSIAKLFNSIGGSCTGAVIAKDEVLTAGHCLYAFRTHRFLPPDAMHVLLGYDRGAYRIHARVVRYRLGPGYDPDAERATATSDWAILDLADPLPDDVKPLQVSSGAPPAVGEIMIAGFARDRAYVMTVDGQCRITGLVDHGRLISHDCSIGPGDSGAPLLQRAEAPDSIRIVGVAIGIWHVGRDQMGIAAPIPLDLQLKSGAAR